MEQITRKYGVLYYGNIKCKDENDAYDWFHDEYNTSMGKAASLYLENALQRKERIHEFGFVRPYDDIPERERCFGHRRVRYRILGLIGIHYCRIVGLWDIPKMTEEQMDRWIEWAFTRGSGGLSLLGRKEGFGRNSKNLRKRYR